MNIFFPLGASTQFRAMVFPYGASLSHSDTPHSVGLVCTGDQPVPETFTWQHTTLTRDIYIPPAAFEPAIPAGEWPQIYALNRTVTGLGNKPYVSVKYSVFLVQRVTVRFCRDYSVESVHVGKVLISVFVQRKTNLMHSFSWVYFIKHPYMFRAYLPPIIRRYAMFTTVGTYCPFSWLSVVLAVKYSAFLYIEWLLDSAETLPWSQSMLARFSFLVACSQHNM